MDRINQILEHPLFIKYMNKNADMELDRIFCKHNLEHMKEVARIADVLVLQSCDKLETRQGIVHAKDIVYTAALLHDIGRHIQYETGEKHAKLGAEMAPEILRDCGYDEDEIAAIVDAIKTHSDKTIINEKTLNGILAKADMLSRDCQNCKARDLCNWTEGEKNHPIL